MAELLPALCDDLAIGLSVHDPETGTIRGVNNRLETMTGETASELRGATITNYTTVGTAVSPDEFQKQVRAAADGNSRSFEWSLADASGDPRHVRVQLSETTHDGESVVLAEWQDISPERDRIDHLEIQERILRQLHEAMSRPLPFEDRLAELLEFGRTVMDIEQGFLTKIDDGTQEVVVGVGDNDQLQDGASAPFSESYCRQTVDRERDNPMTVLNATEEGWADDPAFERFGLGCYIGTELTVDGEVVGTLCFADRDRKSREFSEIQETFLELLADWASTELERLERKRELRRKDRAVEAAPIGVSISDPDRPDNPMVYINDRFEETTGYDESDVIGRNCRFMQGEATSEEPVAAMREAIGRADPVTVELRNYRKNGEKFWNRVSIAPVTDEDGVVTNFVGFQQDVTEQKRRQLELERKSEFLQQTQSVANIGGWEYDLRTESLEWTDEVYNIHGKPLSYEPTVEDALSMYHPEDEERLRAAFKTLTNAGEAFDLTMRIVEDDGDIRWVRSRGTPKYDNGELVAVLGTQQDVTERKEYERQLKRSNDRLQEFAYILSHDLQEPLRMVSSYVCLLEEELDDHLDEETQQYVDFAVDGAERMRGMIDGLLLYSRVETEGSEFDSTDVNEVLDAVRADLELKLADTKVDLSVNDLPTVQADEDQLVQLFENLIKNAVEHGGDGTKVEVSSTETPAGHRFAVADDGPGIPPAEEDDIFGLFDKGGDSNGTGMGLAICQRIVNRHDGDIWVDSEPGEGTTFYFTIDPESPA